MRVVIDHVAGSRRGQRQEFSAGSRVRFGRHPECEVSFDAHRDIDASSRHAELKSVGPGWLLVDLGSSNGTYVEGQRITETSVAPAVPVTILDGDARRRRRGAGVAGAIAHAGKDRLDAVAARELQA